MTTPPMPPTPPQKIQLNDRGDEAEYLLLSGDLDRKLPIVTARVRGGEIDLQGWYWSAFHEQTLTSDPENSFTLDEEATRSLAAILPDLIRELDEGRRRREYDEEQEHLAMAEKTNAENGDV